MTVDLLSRLSQPKAFLFDWDNTLVDSEKISLEALRHTFEILDHPFLSDEELKAMPPTSTRQKFKDLFRDRAVEASRIYYDFYQHIHLRNLSSFSGVEELLRLLRKHSIYCAIVSNKNGDCLRKEVEYFGWTPYFGSIVGSCDLEDDKPSSTVVKHALQPSGLKAHLDVWFVGDSFLDVECAENSGCTPIYLSHERFLPLPFEKELVILKNCQALYDVLVNEFFDTTHRDMT